MTDPKEEKPENDKSENDDQDSNESKEAAKATAESTKNAGDEDDSPAKEDEDTLKTPMKTETKKEPDTAEEDDNESKSTAPPVDESSVATPKTNGSPASATASASKRTMPPGSRRGRAPAVKGLTIPFRTVKKAMKLDPDIPIVQNEAAIMVTLAAELFLKQLAKDSHAIAQNRGRNTIRYEDVAEARSNDSALAFLEMLLP
ncbi:unnamed protein product [Cylindrotheca closterium]|uniref:Transcription factor CBF/NF-Y/archaeal histone domain-containing protein n=1 Tax=Cylindrotheca closterium TaxID=2856 RepID=A0AAD2FW02_9STRA|nr:unnamed protein product [Cylindrotheca closterium]